MYIDLQLSTVILLRMTVNACDKVSNKYKVYRPSWIILDRMFSNVVWHTHMKYLTPYESNYIATTQANALEVPPHFVQCTFYAHTIEAGLCKYTLTHAHTHTHTHTHSIYGHLPALYYDR